MSQWFLCGWPLLGVLLAAAGCGEIFPANEPVQVTGCVRYLGQPLTNGTVTLCADSAILNGSEGAYAQIRSDGSFTFNELHNALISPGHYRITVSGISVYRFTTPQRYLHPATSGLRCTIEPNEAVSLVIELE